MKYRGESIDGPQPTYVVIPKGDREYVFQATMVRDYSCFDAIYPRPEPTKQLMAGDKEATPVLDDEYNEKISEYVTARTHWMILESLKGSEDIEWETVDMSVPSTFGNYQAELEEAGFSDIEGGSIISAVTAANGKDPGLIEAATKTFLVGLAENLDKQ